MDDPDVGQLRTKTDENTASIHNKSHEAPKFD